jgi:hypothetical protein
MLIGKLFHIGYTPRGNVRVILTIRADKVRGMG